MSARNPCSLMVAGENKSFALSSLRGKSGTFMIPAYSTGGLPPTAWVMSAVIVWLGRVLRSVQESPPSSETKMGAVALAEPPGFGEGRGRHETRVRGVQRQEWLGVLPAFPTQRDRDQVHNPYARQLGRRLWPFSL